MFELWAAINFAISAEFKSSSAQKRPRINVLENARRGYSRYPGVDEQGVRVYTSWADPDPCPFCKQDHSTTKCPVYEMEEQHRRSLAGSRAD